MNQPRRPVRVIVAAVAAIGLPATALVLSNVTQASADSRPPQVSTSPVVKDRPQSTDLVGLTDKGRLVKFRSTSPDRIRRTTPVKGLKDDQRLIGIDFRVQDGKLYGVGDRGGIYTISTGSDF